jgi:predicted Ser/Thr protein kinase
MSGPATCERSGGALPAGKPAGHCPRCLLDLAMAPSRPSAAGGRGAPAPAIAELQPLFPDYELQELLGRGGMGAVYRAHHGKLDRTVAIKVLLPDLHADPAFVERFVREAKALAKLAHPGIVGVHDIGTAGTFCYLVMEFVDGASLRDLLLQGRLTARDVLAYVPQLCDALQYAHDQGIVHRDIKPENILIDADGRVKIADFGLAKLAGGGAAPVALTRTAQAVGTPHYMAPEQIEASHRVDHRADLYSLGVVLYEMLTGQLPIGRFQPPSAKASTPRAFDPVVMRSLENDPDERYQAAGDVKRDVEAAGTAGNASAAGAAASGAEHPHGERRAHAARPATTLASAADTGTLWQPWGATAGIAMACFAPWATLYGQVKLDGAPVFSDLHAMFPGGLNSMTATAWNFTLADVPAWVLLPLSAGIALALTLRTMGQNVPRALPAILAGAGFAYCLVMLFLAAASEQLTLHLGAWLASIVFAVQAWHLILAPYWAELHGGRRGLRPSRRVPA